jgi:hypothetical protein
LVISILIPTFQQWVGINMGVSVQLSLGDKLAVSTFVAMLQQHISTKGSAVYKHGKVWHSKICAVPILASRLLAAGDR